MKVKCYAEGSWFTSSKSGKDVFHAVSGGKIGEVSSEGLDFKAMLEYGRNVVGPKLRELTFHERALRLKAMAQHLMEKKSRFYEISAITGATTGDSWIDIEGGIGTLFTYSSKGRKEFPDEVCASDGKLERVSKQGTFVGHHLLVPKKGVAVHINAFNFPCWGMLEKLAPSFLGGMPVIIKPATSTCYLTQAMVEEMVASEIFPEGSIQLICGSVGDLFEHLICQDVVTLTGSRTTGVKLKSHPRIIEHSIPFNLEADSLNCSILGEDAKPGTEEFRLFIREVSKEMCVKAGQKCTAIRRSIVPKGVEEAVISALKEKLETITLGNPATKGVAMGPLASREQVDDVGSQVSRLQETCELLLGDRENFEVLGASPKTGAFFPKTLLYCAEPFKQQEVHEIEAFGPVNTIMTYSGVEEAVELANLGDGSLVGSLFTADDQFARKVALETASYHGRLLLMNSYCSGESTGHGSPLPHLVHGGPGRAGGGEELGGIRSVYHYLQRTAVQGSPERLTRVFNVWQTGAERNEKDVHPFRKHFDELEIGESLTTESRIITEEDVENFAHLSGDHFYAHMDEVAAKDSFFGKRVAHGYLVLSAAAGLFVDPAPGPVIANYGLEKLRFIEPVYIGDSITAHLTCKEKKPKEGEPHGVVAWDVQVYNQDNLLVAIYTILTLVKNKQH